MVHFLWKVEWAQPRKNPFEQSLDNDRGGGVSLSAV